RATCRRSRCRSRTGRPAGPGRRGSFADRVRRPAQPAERWFASAQWIIPLVHPGGGVALIAAALVCGAFTLFVLWPRLPSVVGLAMMAVCGAAIAAGGLLLQDDPGNGDRILAIAVLAALAPLHSRLVFGPP